MPQLCIPGPPRGSTTDTEQHTRFQAVLQPSSSLDPTFPQHGTSDLPQTASASCARVDQLSVVWATTLFLQKAPAASLAAFLITAHSSWQVPPGISLQPRCFHVRTSPRWPPSGERDGKGEREKKKTNQEHDVLEALLVAHGALRPLLALGSLSAINLMGGGASCALGARCLRWSWVTDEQFSPPCDGICLCVLQHAVVFFKR